MDDSDEISQLELLLAAEIPDEAESQNKPLENKSIGFLEDVETACASGYTVPLESCDNSNVLLSPPENSKNSFIHNGDTDSSDDEDKKSMHRKYDNYGTEIKRMLDINNENEKDRKFERENRLDLSAGNERSPPDFSTRLRMANSAKFNGYVRDVINTKSKSFITQKIIDESKDVYTDPVFGIRIVKPLISNAALLERMQGREVIKLCNIKRHVQYGDLSLDWVFAGVIVRKSDTRESQKGSQFSIWTLSDLKDDLKTTSLFLFKNAHKNLWKTNRGTVVGILNPGILDKKDDSRDEACLSVDNSDKVMIIGQSKDLGFCRSRKKNGDPCNAFVNLSQGEVCIFHIRQEYQKFANRSELQSPTMGRGLVNLQNKVLGKNTYIYGGKSYSAIPKGKNKVLEKDNNRLMSLDLYFKKTENDHLHVNKAPLGNNPLKTNFSKASFERRTRDRERLELLGSSLPSIDKTIINNTTISKNNILNRNKVMLQQTLNSNLLPISPNIPKLGIGLTKGSVIDFDLSYTKKQADKAKENALKWIQKNGPLKKNNPHNLKGSEEGKKRALQQLSESDGTVRKKVKIDEEKDATLKSERFKKMLEVTSAHADLVQDYEDCEKDKYFNKLEKKEAMEEKMLNTFKLPCKAVRCLRCKYTSFSASDKCKEEKHPLRVFDSFKRFFKCLDCGNRTVSLELIPLHSCKNCRSSRWKRTGMMKEKIAIVSESLSIRGEEEKSLGNVQTGANINLLVPEE